MAEHDDNIAGDTGEPSGSVSERLARLQTLEDGEAANHYFTSLIHN